MNSYKPAIVVDEGEDDDYGAHAGEVMLMLVVVMRIGCPCCRCVSQQPCVL